MQLPFRTIPLGLMIPISDTAEGHALRAERHNAINANCEYYSTSLPSYAQSARLAPNFSRTNNSAALGITHAVKWSEPL